MGAAAVVVAEVPSALAVAGATVLVDGKEEAVGQAEEVEAAVMAGGKEEEEVVEVAVVVVDEVA
jgi:ABC-type protease/lipase transport system fused ATPase/permease subunit